MELAFTDREGIMGLMEGLIATAFRDVLGVEVRDEERESPGGGVRVVWGLEGRRLREYLTWMAASECGCVV